MIDSVDIHSRIDYDRQTAQPDAAQVREFRRYARGRQRATLTPGQQRILRGLLGQTFCDNVCAMVIGQIAARLTLLRFDVESNAPDAGAAIEQFLREFWTFNRLPSLSTAVHAATLRDGNHAAALIWRDGRVRVVRERWWDGDSGIFVAYDDIGAPLYAVKEWQDASGRYRTVWFPDRIERYIASGAGWRPYQLPGDDGWPVMWLDRRGEPLGLPVVHFAALSLPNDPADARDPAPHYGVSALDGGLLGLQDEINDIHRDISAAARFAGYQMLYATGVTPPRDAQGRPLTLAVEPGAFFFDESPHARFGALPAGSLAELERTLTVKLQAVTRLTGVPQHLIAGEWPSGEALLRAERPLIDRVEALARAFGPAWASLAHKATRLANTFGGMALDEDAPITAVFAPAERRDPLTRAQIAAAEAPYVSRRQTLRTLGYGPAEQERILAELREEQAMLLSNVLAKLQIPGFSPQQALRELGYDDATIAAMQEEAQSSGDALGEALLTAFDRGR